MSAASLTNSHSFNSLSSIESVHSQPYDEPDGRSSRHQSGQLANNKAPSVHIDLPLFQERMLTLPDKALPAILVARSAEEASAAVSKKRNIFFPNKLSSEDTKTTATDLWNQLHIDGKLNAEQVLYRTCYTLQVGKKTYPAETTQYGKWMNEITLESHPDKWTIVANKAERQNVKSVNVKGKYILSKEGLHLKVSGKGQYSPDLSFWCSITTNRKYCYRMDRSIQRTLASSDSRISRSPSSDYSSRSPSSDSRSSSRRYSPSEPKTYRRGEGYSSRSSRRSSRERGYPSSRAPESRRHYSGSPPSNGCFPPIYSYSRQRSQSTGGIFQPPNEHEFSTISGSYSSTEVNRRPSSPRVVIPSSVERHNRPLNLSQSHTPSLTSTPRPCINTDDLPPPPPELLPTPSPDGNHFQFPTLLVKTTENRSNTSSALPASTRSSKPMNNGTPLAQQTPSNKPIIAAKPTIVASTSTAAPAAPAVSAPTNTNKGGKSGGANRDRLLADIRKGVTLQKSAKGGKSGGANRDRLLADIRKGVTLQKSAPAQTDVPAQTEEPADSLVAAMIREVGARRQGIEGIESNDSDSDREDKDDSEWDIDTA